MLNIRKFKVCIDIKNGELTCLKPTIILKQHKDLLQNCELKDGCIEFSILQEDEDKLKGVCIPYTIICDDCGHCPPKDGEICFCDSNADCNCCSNCIGGVCLPKCTKECKDCSCVDCKDSECPTNQVCINGECDCPLDKPLKRPDGTCYQCENDKGCPRCYRCDSSGSCVPISNCICDPTLGKCVECVDSAICKIQDPNKCCVKNECVCCPGYTLNPVTGKCEPTPPCKTGDDCPDCSDCVEGKCVKIVCPDCFKCDKDNCVPDPCRSTPCKDGTGCSAGCSSEGCGCYNGVCTECSKLECKDCDFAKGCKCDPITNKCIKAPDCNTPCSNFDKCGEGCGCFDNKCLACENFTCEDCGKYENCQCINGKCKIVPPPPPFCETISCEDCAKYSYCKCTSGKCIGDPPPPPTPCTVEFKLLEECNNETPNGCKIVGTLSNNACNCEPIEFKTSVTGLPTNLNLDNLPTSLNINVAMFKAGKPYAEYKTLIDEIGSDEVVSAELYFKTSIFTGDTPNDLKEVTNGAPTVYPAISSYNKFGTIKADIFKPGTNYKYYRYSIDVIAKNVKVDINNCKNYDKDVKIATFIVDNTKLLDTTNSLKEQSVKLNDKTSRKKPLFIWSKSEIGTNSVSVFRKIHPQIVNGSYQDKVGYAEGLELGYKYLLKSDCKDCFKNDLDLEPNFCCNVEVEPNVTNCATKLNEFQAPKLCDVNSKTADYVLEIKTSDGKTEKVVNPSRTNKITKTYGNGVKIDAISTYLEAKKPNKKQYCREDYTYQSDIKDFTASVDCINKRLKLLSTSPQSIVRVESKNFPDLDKVFGDPGVLSDDSISFDLDKYMAATKPVDLTLHFKGGCFVETELNSCDPYLNLTTDTTTSCVNFDKGSITADAVGLPQTGVSWEINGEKSTGNNPRTFSGLTSGNYTIKANNLTNTINLVNDTRFKVDYSISPENGQICKGVSPVITVEAKRSNKTSNSTDFTVQLEKNGAILTNPSERRFQIGESPQTHKFTITEPGEYKVVLKEPNDLVCIESKTITVTDGGKELNPFVTANTGEYCLNSPISISFQDYTPTDYVSVTGVNGIVDLGKNTFTPTNKTGPYNVDFKLSQDSCDYFLVDTKKVASKTILLTGITIKNQPSLVHKFVCDSANPNPKIEVTSSVVGDTITSIKLFQDATGIQIGNNLIQKPGSQTVWITDSYIVPGKYNIVSETSAGCKATLVINVQFCLDCSKFKSLPIQLDQLCSSQQENIVYILPFIETGNSKTIRQYYSQGNPGQNGNFSLVWYINNVEQSVISFDTQSKVFIKYPNNADISILPTDRFPAHPGDTIKYKMTLPNTCIIESDTVTINKQEFIYVGLGKDCDGDNGCFRCSADLCCGEDNKCKCCNDCPEIPLGLGEECKIDACGQPKQCQCEEGLICGEDGTCINPDVNPPCSGCCRQSLTGACLPDSTKCDPPGFASCNNDCTCATIS